jgi:hypothetical protein
MAPGQTRYHYLDLRPSTVVQDGFAYRRRNLLHWGPAQCFYKDDLYTLHVRGLTSDQFEKRFFGDVDRHGRKAVETFGSYDGFNNMVHESFPILPAYMDAQRFRTPRGLDHLRKLASVQGQNQTLVVMSQLFRLHTTMWTEGVWEVVFARNSRTKFIVSDEPVTFFNRRIFPSEVDYPGGDIELNRVGTRTLFPLGLESCLIVTHVQLIRNPWQDPLTVRTNARAYQQSLVMTNGTHFGRELEEEEVLRVNWILKKRATRYIAAAERDWLYPESKLGHTEWAKLDEDWFLYPHLWKVPFTSETVVGYEDGSSYAQDEYGRRRNNPKYRDKKSSQEEWESHLRAQKEWAVKREGKSVAHTEQEPGGRWDQVGDNLMKEYLENRS